MTKRVAICAPTVLVFLIVAQTIRSFGQDLPDVAQGLRPYVAYHGGELDQVNTFNGSLTMRIPLLSYPQKGSLSLSYSIIFNSFGFEDIGSCIAAQGVTGPIAVIPLHNGCTNNVQLIPTGIFRNLPVGPRLVADQVLVAGGLGLPQNLDTVNPPTSARFYVLTQDNAEHTLGLANDGSWRSVDGSSFMFVPSAPPSAANNNIGTMENAYSGDETRLMGVAPGTITDSRGVVYTATGITDADGNSIAISNAGAGQTGFYAGLPATDSTGRSIPIPASSTATCPTISQATNQPISSGSTMIWTPPGTGNGYLFCFAAVTLNSTAQFPQIHPGNGSTQYSRTVTMLQSIVLPNSTYWGFIYDSYAGSGTLTGSGQLMKLIYPTGGTVSYTYGTAEGPCDNLRESGLVPASLFVFPASVKSRSMTDGNNWSATWNYTYPPSASGAMTGSILSPVGDLTVTKWIEDNDNSGCGSVSGGQDDYEGNPNPVSGTPLKSTVLTYTGTAANNPPGGSTLRIYKETTVLSGTNTSSVQYGYAPSVSLSIVNCDQYYNNCAGAGGTPALIGPPTSKTYTDYNGAVLKTDSTAYQWQTNSAYFTSNFLDLPSQIQTLNASPSTIASMTYTYDETAYSPGGTRGHPTTTTEWLNTGSSPTTHTGWNSMGEKSFFIDAKSNLNGNGHTIDYSYQNTGAGCYGSLVTGTTNALGKQTSGTYNCNTGLLATYSDLNSRQTTFTWDSTRRLICVEYPDGGSTAFNINDTARTVDKIVRLKGGDACQSTANNIDTQYQFDGLGRQVETRLLSDPSGTIYTDTTYDSDGRVSSVSNPYRSSSDATYGITGFSYDALNRKVIETKQDGTARQWCFDGNASNKQTNCRALLGSGSGEWVDYSDEVTNDWQKVNDSLGRLTRVYEPNGSSRAPSMETDYGYDGLNNLLSVTQWGGANGSPNARSRSFSYDSLSRLISAANPESGTTTYYFVNTSNQLCAGDTSLPCRKTDARSVTTTYSYDGLNRLLSKSYSDGSTLSSCYQFDTATIGIGRLGAEWTQAGTCSSSLPSGNQSQRVIGAYDSMGRMLAEQQCAAGYCTSTSVPSSPSPNCTSLSSAAGLQYCYDLVGNLLAFSNGVTTQTASSYPQQAILFSQTFDAASRLATVGSSWNDTTHPASLFSSTTYSAANALSNWLLGTSLWTARQYDARLRVCNQQSAQQQNTAPACQ